MMKDIFGIDAFNRITPFRGFGSHRVFFIGFHPMLMISHFVAGIEISDSLLVLSNVDDCPNSLGCTQC